MSVNPDRFASRRRVGVAAAIIAVHLALAVLLAWSRSPPSPAPPATTMVVTAIPAPPAPPPVVRDLPFDAQVIAPPIVAAPPAVDPLPCDVLAELDAALHADPSVAAALAPAAAGVTHAIMVWNGRWPDEPEVQPVRRTVVVALTAVRSDCLDDVLIGPRLIFIAVDQTIVSVAIGSGTWQWRDLLSPD